jgi:hypothetical protein
MVSKMGTGAARMCLGWPGETSDERCNQRTSRKAEEVLVGGRQERKTGSTGSMHERVLDMMDA